MPSQDAGGDQLQSWIVVVLQLLHGGAELRPLLYAFHLSERVQTRRAHVVVWVVQAVQYRGQDQGVVEQVRGALDGYQVLVQEVGLILRDGSSRDSRVTVHELWVSHFFQEDAGGGGVQMGEGGLTKGLGLRVGQEVLQGDSDRGSLDVWVGVVQAR